MHHTQRPLRSLGFGILLIALLTMAGAGVAAQGAATPMADAASARPVHIHAGVCPEVGDVVAPLTELTGPGGATADAATPMMMMSGAIPVEYSFTTVELPLDAILGAEHAINVHESAENIGNYIACGDLQGTVDANGSLVVGLGEVNDSGFAGIAVLSPNADDPATTDVSVFVANGLSDDGM
jgi:hypothetical protein